MSIWIIRFEDEKNRELSGLRGSVRVAAHDQVTAEVRADEILNGWLAENPGRVGSWSITLWLQPAYRRDAA